MMSSLIGQLLLERLKFRSDDLPRSKTFHNKEHGAYPATVHRRGALRHVVVDVTSLEHRARLVFPVFRCETLFDSALAITENLRIGSIHSKRPFVGSCVLCGTCFSPHIDGRFELFVQTLREYRA